MLRASLESAKDSLDKDAVNSTMDCPAEAWFLVYMLFTCVIVEFLTSLCAKAVENVEYKPGTMW